MAAAGSPPKGKLRILADWISRAVFGGAVAAGWVALGPPWSPRGAEPEGVLESAAVVVGAFVLAALAQRVILAEYALKAGPIELSAVESATVRTTFVAERVTRDLEESLAKVASDVAQLKSGGDVLSGRISSLSQRAQLLEESDEAILEAVTTLYREVTGT